MVLADRAHGQGTHGFFCRGLIGQSPSLLSKPDPDCPILSVARRKTSGKLILQQGGSPQGPPSKSLRAPGRHAKVAGLRLNHATERDGNRAGVGFQCPERLSPPFPLLPQCQEESHRALWSVSHLSKDRFERRKNSSRVGVACSLQLLLSSASARGCGGRGTE